MYRRFIIIVFFVLFSVVLVAQKYKLDVQLDGLNATFGNFVIYDPCGEWALCGGGGVLLSHDNEYRV